LLFPIEKLCFLFEGLLDYDCHSLEQLLWSTDLTALMLNQLLPAQVVSTFQEPSWPPGKVAIFKSFFLSHFFKPSPDLKIILSVAHSFFFL
jgi:hypothetical protein